MTTSTDYRLQRATVSGTGVLPVAVHEFKQFAKIEHDDESLVVESVIRSAASWLEEASGLTFITTEYVLKPAEFGLAVYVPRWPIQTIDAVKYVDTSGSLQTLSASLYQCDTTSHPVLIIPAASTDWPSVQEENFAPIRVEFTAGYGDTSDTVPHLARTAICLLASHMYSTRLAVGDGAIPMSIMRVIEPLMMNGVVA